MKEPRVEQQPALAPGPGAARHGGGAGRRSGEGARGVNRPAADQPPGGATTAMPSRGADPVSATTMLPAQKLPVDTGESRSAGFTRFLSPVFALVAVALLPVAAVTTDLYALDGWGLAKVLGPAAWGAILCAVAACVSELWARRPRIPMLATATGVLILCTNGLPSVIEPAARFGTAWTTVGFVDAIAAENGVSPVGLDARFYWPAFFAQWAWFREAGGADNLDTVLRWFPPVLVTITAIGIYAMGRSMLGGTRAPWVAAWLFVGLNWIEQDYFSPQAQAVVLMLTVLTFALGPLATRRIDAAGVPGWPAPHPGSPRLPLVRRWLVAAMTPPNRPALPPRQLLFIYFCMILCMIAVVVEHQLTPIALIGQLTLLAVVGRFRGRAVLIVGIMGVALWIFVNNREFWTSQLGILIGTGDTGEALQAGVADRVSAGDEGQVFVKQLRFALAGFTYLLGAAGMLVYWRRRRDLVPFGLAVIPMGLAIQGYGSEAFLRILLYGLPILVILGTDALRWLARRWRPSEYLLAAAMIAMAGMVVLVRGGNEAYQVTFPEEVAMYRQVIAETPPELEIVAFNQAGPTGLEGITTYGRGDNIEGCGQLADDPLVCADKQDADVLVNYLSGEKYGVHLELRPPGWSLDIVQQLVSSGRYVLTYQNGFNVVLKKAVPAGDQGDPQGGDQGGQGGDEHNGGDQAGDPAGAAGQQPAGQPAAGG